MYDRRDDMSTVIGTSCVRIRSPCTYKVLEISLTGTYTPSCRVRIHVILPLERIYEETGQTGVMTIP
jgi:hypothetical protein